MEAVRCFLKACFSPPTSWPLFFLGVTFLIFLPLNCRNLACSLKSMANVLSLFKPFLPTSPFWVRITRFGSPSFLRGILLFSYFSFFLILIEFLLYNGVKWQPTPVLLPGKSHGQRSLAGYSPWGPKSQTQLSN